MIGAFGVNIAKVSSDLAGVFEEGVESDAIFAMEATVAGLWLKALGLLRWEFDVGVDVGWDHGA